MKRWITLAKLMATILLGTVLSIVGYMVISDKNVNEVGLSFFTIIKKAKGETVDLNDIQFGSAAPISHVKWTRILQDYVSEDGNVDYRGLQNNRQILADYLQHLSANPPLDTWPKADQLAYWINAYNAFTIQLIIDHYPIKSIKDISDGLPMINSPWDIKFFKIGGVDFDLNTIEHEILRKQFDEPRIHFAINCASFSCPKLRNEAFTADNLDEQLELQALAFINNPEQNIINDSTTQVSLIFNWFKSDFTKSGSLNDYLQQYTPQIKPNNTITYLDYDWSLNE